MEDSEGQRSPPSFDATAGDHFGRLAAEHLYNNVQEFTEGFRRMETPVAFVEFVLSARVNRNTKRRLREALDELNRETFPRWMETALKDAFGMYCMARRCAVPAAVRPEVVPEGSMHVPRRLQRLLTSHGITSQTFSDRRTMKQKADDQRRVVQDSLQGVHSVVWLDNYFRKRYVSNPMVGYNALNCSVMSILQVSKLTRCPVPPSITTVVTNCATVATQLRNAADQMLEFIEDLFEAGSLHRGDIRVPLDIVRHGVRSLQWTPLQLVEESVGTREGFLHLLHHVHSVWLPQCRTPLPVLVDLNLYYRHMKIMYGLHYRRWAYAEHFRHMPMLFGVWHSYKYACTLVFRRFHTQFVYLQRGTVGIGENFPTKPRLRTLEMLFAGILLQSNRTRAQLHDCVNLRLQVVQRAETALRVHRRWLHFHRNMTPAEAATADAKRRQLQHVLDASQEALLQAQAMERLVCQYVPALFLAGKLVRDCHWAGQEGGSARSAWMAMAHAAVIMLCATKDTAHKVEHLRSVCLALLMWQEWHDTLPAALFSEEVAEASLGRFGELLRSNPQVTTVEAADDLFLLVRPGTRGLKDIRGEGPTATCVDRVHVRLQAFMQAADNVVTHVPWSASRMCTAQATSYTFAELPVAFGDLPSEESLRLMLIHFVHLMLHGSPPKGPIVQALDDCIAHRTNPERHAYEVQVANLNIRPLPSSQGRLSQRTTQSQG